MTIEETRQAVKESARIVAAGLDHPDSIMKAADAYAMSVLEGVLAAQRRGDQSLSPLRARIAALGSWDGT